MGSDGHLKLADPNPNPNHNHNQVGSDGHLKLADFGTAKRLPEVVGADGAVQSGYLHTIVGTPGMFAPIQTLSQTRTRTHKLKPESYP